MRRTTDEIAIASRRRWGRGATLVVASWIFARAALAQEPPPETPPQDPPKAEPPKPDPPKPDPPKPDPPKVDLAKLEPSAVRTRADIEWAPKSASDDAMLRVTLRGETPMAPPVIAPRARVRRGDSVERVPLELVSENGGNPVYEAIVLHPSEVSSIDVVDEDGVVLGERELAIRGRRSDESRRRRRNLTWA